MKKENENSTSKRAEILIAEDSPSQAIQIKHLLEKHNFKVAVAQDGKQALDLISKHKPSLVISDILMPEMNGYELCKNIKLNRDTEDIPVILLTRLSDPEEIIEGLSCGADSFITKPYHEENLLSNVTKLISDENRTDQKKMPFGVQIVYKGEKRFIQAEQQNVINFMISIYEGAVLQNEKLIQTQEELRLLNERLESMVEDRTSDLAAEIKLSNQITKRLKESEERWRTLVLTMPEYIGLVDYKGKFLFLNHYLKGFSEKDTIGKSHLEFIPDEWKELYHQKFVKCITTQKNQVFEYSAFGDNKDIRTYETCLAPIINKGKVSNVMAIARDITDRKHAEEKIRFLAYRQEAILAAVPNIIMEVDKNKVYAWANKSGYEFFGNDVIGREAASFFVGKQDTYNIVQPLFEGKENDVYVENLQWRKDGEARALAWWCRTLKDKDGNVTGTLSSAQDITERSLAEKAVLESERKYHNIFDNVTDLYYETSLDGTIIDVSPSISILSNGQYHREDLIGKSISEFYSDPDKRQSFITKLKKDGRVTDYEITLKNRDGSSVPCSVSSKISIDSQGKPEKIIGSMRDITDRKLMEDELKKSQSQLINALKIAHLGPWEYDVETNTFIFNDPFYAIFRTTAEQVGGYTMKSADYARRFVHPDDLPMVGIEISKAIETDDPNFSRQFEHRIIYADGETGYITVRFFIVKDSSGKTVRTYGVNQDITERKRVEVELSKASEQMKLAKEKAEASDRLKSTFLNNISHEVRTPLNGILGFAEIMSQTELSEEEKQVSLSMLIESSDRLLDTVTNYMDISLITSGNMVVNTKEFAPGQIMKGLFGKYKVICSNRKIELMSKIPEHSGLLSVNSDSEILYKIMSHLLSNAVKFTEKGNIQFGYEIRKNELEFCVKDSGIGIGKESLINIFDRFVKEDRGPLKITEGSGLGLSISKGLVELLGGKIWVESEIGKGSVFFFTIPLPKENKIHHSVISTDSKNKIKTVRSILVAEDDEINFFYLKALLRQITSANIIHVSNGKEAIEKLKENPDIGLVLMDIKMPVMDGYTAVKFIRESKSDIPIIAQTAYFDDRAKALEIGCNGFLSKPFDKQKLLSVVKEFINIQ